jgi:hypothetical protein
MSRKQVIGIVLAMLLLALVYSLLPDIRAWHRHASVRLNEYVSKS